MVRCSFHTSSGQSVSPIAWIAMNLKWKKVSKLTFVVLNAEQLKEGELYIDQN